MLVVIKIRHEYMEHLLVHEKLGLELSKKVLVFSCSCNQSAIGATVGNFTVVIKVFLHKKHSSMIKCNY